MLTKKIILKIPIIEKFACQEIILAEVYGPSLLLQLCQELITFRQKLSEVFFRMICEIGHICSLGFTKK
jgi:hypothetical protein